MKSVVLGLLALLALAGSGRAASPCGSLNFFPTAAQIAATSVSAASVAVTTGVTCRGSQVCNWPAVLNKTAQEANLTALGASISADGLLSVAVKEYGAKQLRFFFTPTSPLLTAGANARACVLAQAPAATRRRLQQAGAYTVTSPGAWSYTAAFSAGGSTTSGGLRAAGAVGDVTFSTEGLQDDETYCAAITVLLQGYGVDGAPATFPAQLPLKYNVCFFKHNGQARAAFKFGTCRAAEAGATFTVNVSGVTPLAQNLSQNGEALLDGEGKPQLLLQPVIQIFGRMNKTILGDPVDEGAAFVNEYFLLPTGMAASDTITLSLDRGDLQEGYYELSAKVAVLTRFPNLVDLQGPAAINQSDREEVTGFTEYMGYLVRNGSDDDTPLLGLQSAGRLPTISDISVNKEGTAIQAGDVLAFSWHFVAAGAERCYHDGVELLSPPCASPMEVRAKAFTGNATSHNFSVIITDVCGATKAANFSYSPNGARALSEVDYVDPTSMDESGSYSGAVGAGGVTAAGTRRGSVSAAGQLPARAGAWLRAAAAAGVLVAGLLL